MEYFEKEKNSLPQKNTPEVWFRYVDNTFVIWKHDRIELRKFLIFLHNQHQNIHFFTISKYPIDIKKNGKPFLDVLLVYKKVDGTLGHQVYRKPIHTDRYLYAETHHHSAQK